MQRSYKLKAEILLIFFLLILLTAFEGLARTETKINLIAVDKSGDLVSGLAKEEISVFIDGKEQPNFVLEKETLPLIYMIALDNSGSMRLLIDDIKEAARILIEQNQPEDLTSLMRFVSSDKIQMLEKFSSDKNYLLSKFEMFYAEGGQTALTDAIYKSVQAVAAQPNKDGKNYRRIVVVVSDGEDRASAYTMQQLKELLNKENVQIFFVGLIEELGDKSGSVTVIKKDKDGKTKVEKEKYGDQRKLSVEYIEKTVAESGGVAIFPKKDKKISEIAGQIAAQMRTQFVVKITTDEIPDNKKIEIKPSKNAEKRKLKFFYRGGITK